MALVFVMSASAQSGSNVVVVINQASSDSERIGARYAASRGVPAENVVRLKTTTSDDIDRAALEYEIERPISEVITRNEAQDHILYIVVTKGIPLRVRGTAGLDGTMASVDSELALLYRKLLGSPVPPGGRIPNPYYLGDRPISAAAPFSHAAYDMYLVTRLDGFTVEDALKVVERGAAPVNDGRFVLDARASMVGNRSGDSWLTMAADRLSAAGLKDRVLLDTKTSVAAPTGPILGYYSWGSNDPSVTSRNMNLQFVPGALAGMFVSTDARTFKEPPASWTIGKWGDRKGYFEDSPQSLVGDLIRAGATGVSGHVAEPFLDGSARPQIVFPSYVAGFNLAESFYLGIPFLSWQNLVVGDPLCVPFKRTPAPADELSPPMDPDTELPKYFSARRLAVLSSYGVRTEISKL